MHTDEYEISLSRELKVCSSTIKKLKRVLASLEKKYKIESETFVEKYIQGGITGDNEDFGLWIKSYEDLNKWEERLIQYEELFRSMKA